MNKMTPRRSRFLPWLCFLLLVGALAFASLGNAPLDNPPQLTATPQPVLLVPGPTALPAEYFRTQEQSSLITLGAVLLVLIIVISAVSALISARKSKR